MPLFPVSTVMFRLKVKVYVFLRFLTLTFHSPFTGHLQQVTAAGVQKFTHVVCDQGPVVQDPDLKLPRPEIHDVVQINGEILPFPKLEDPTGAVVSAV